MRATPPVDLRPPGPTASTPHASPLSPLFERLHPSPETLLLVLSLIIGGVTGAGVVTFHYLIHFIHSLRPITLNYESPRKSCTSSTLSPVTWAIAALSSCESNCRAIDLAFTRIPSSLPSSRPSSAALIIAPCWS